MVVDHARDSSPPRLSQEPLACPVARVEGYFPRGASDQCPLYP